MQYSGADMQKGAHKVGVQKVLYFINIRGEYILDTEKKTGKHLIQLVNT